jgi:aerobic-type carbon monoxide dehydrogenase small subunit (CoxS/CutS family)
VVELRVNGEDYRVDVPVGRTLAAVLRDSIGLIGTKIACGEGHCGACTVLLDGTPTLSCITLAHTVRDREVTTIEGLREHPLVDAFVRSDALQCGFCTPGQIVSAAALVASSPRPTREEIRHRMAGNLCRCGAYPKIEEAILTVGGTAGSPHEPSSQTAQAQSPSGSIETSSAPPKGDR